MSEFNIEDLDVLIARSREGSLAQLLALQLKCQIRKSEQLAAENAGLKAFGDKLSEMHNALNGEGTGIQGRAEVACQQVALEAAMEEFEAIETHATDRIVAEVEARGVDKLAMRRRAAAKVALDEFNDVKNHAELESEAWRAEMFAAELREGAK